MADNDAFERALLESVNRLPAVSEQTWRKVQTVLQDLEQQIIRDMAAGGSDWQAYQLPRLQAAIRQALADSGEALASIGADGLSDGWLSGVSVVDIPVEAGSGLSLASVTPSVDIRQLAEMQSFMTGKMTDLASDLIPKIDGQLALVLAGGQSPHKAIETVTGLLDGNMRRARTIVRTEVGRAFATATQARQEQAEALLPGMQKQWRRSGKLHSRPRHDALDGKVVGVQEKFAVGTSMLLHPRDPSGPASETVNCGCASLPHMAHWEMSLPGQRPYTEIETTRNPVKRDIAAATADDAMQEQTMRKAIGSRYDAAVRSIEKMQLPESFSPLTMAEKVALNDYTGNGFLDINGKLRRNEQGSREAGYAGVINSALDKLPTHTGPVERGLSLTAQEIEEQFDVGKSWSSASPLSTSRTDPFDGNVRLAIQSKSGRKIEDISNIQMEDEVLFKAGTKFVTVSKQQQPDGSWKIGLKEAPDDGGVL